MTAPILFITGTDTGVGKTVTTAGLAVAIQAARARRGRPSCSLAVDKPTQTGVSPQESGDVDETRRLSGVTTTSEGIRLRLPMAPVAAARREAATLPSIDDHITRIRELARTHDHVLVEGAGGILVQLDNGKQTLADLAARFIDAAVVVVCRSGLGTLNHTELTLEALARRGLSTAGIVIGSWPSHPDHIDLDNRSQLSSLDVPLVGVIPEGASRLAPTRFRAQAPAWFNHLS
jgi:dethiobiotin synthetase